MDVEFPNSIPTAQILPALSLSGRRVGPYLLLSELGRGGMGNVWLARRDDGQYEAQVAIKLLAAAWLSRDGATRFRHEGRLLARLDHPNIARLLDAGVTEHGEPYLVLEYVQGQRVDDYCRKAGLGVRQRIELFLELLSAVAHAHRSLVVHRDIKPANVLVTADGKAKLLDFGIGKLVQGDEELTRAGHALLTPEYAAPEQLLGDPVTTATDIYSLGLLLYVILAERLPYADVVGSPAELFRRITTGAMPLPSSIAMTQLRAGSAPIAHKTLQRELRGDLDNIVIKAMHSAPEQRYQNVGAFAADLRRFLNHEPVSARANTAWYRVRKFARRKRLTVAATALVIVAATVAAAVTTTQALEARDQRAAAQVRQLAARRLADFLNRGLLSDAEPGQPAPTMEQRIERAVTILEQTYAKDPALAASLFVQLAERLAIQGGTTVPERLLERSYELAKLGGDNGGMIFARCGLARRLYATGKLDAGERVMDTAKAMIMRRGPQTDVYVECRMAEAYGKIMRGDYAAAKPPLFDAQRRLERDGQTETITYAAVYSYLSGVYTSSSEYAAGLDVAQRSAELERRIGSGGTSQHLATLQNIALLRFLMGEVRQSLAERVQINEQILKIYTPETTPPTMRSNYAGVLVRMGDAREALRVLDPNLDRLRSEDNPGDLLVTLSTKVAAHLALQEWDAAERALLEAQPLVDKQAGPPNILSQVMGQRAEVAFARNDAAKAREHMAAALSLAGYQTERTTRGLPRLLLAAGRMALLAGSLADAQTYANEALRITTRVARTQTSSADVGEALLLLVRVQTATQPLAHQQVALLERAVQCLTNGLGANHALTLEAAALLDQARSTVK